MKTSLRTCTWIISLALCAATGSFAEAEALPGLYVEELQNVVVVSRHGVRAPTQSDQTLSGWTAKPWPNWGTQPAYLTQRGFYLVKRTWELNRVQSPFVYGECPKPEDVAIYADVDERTIKTAQALTQGLYPGCGYPVRVARTNRSALFSPLKAKVCSIDDPDALEEKLDERGAPLASKYASEIARVEKILGRPLDGKMRAKVGKHKVGFKGAPYEAASITEIFALEWGQFADQKVAWGELDWSGIKSLMPLRVAEFSALNRDMEVARYKGSALAAKIMASLDHGPKYTYLIGHDTNLANLGAIFDLEWQLPDRVRNENTPGGYLTFEKWLVNGVAEIRVSYSALSPEQIHAEEVTQPAQTVEILPRGILFETWKRTYSRHLESKCIADDE